MPSMNGGPWNDVHVEALLWLDGHKVHLIIAHPLRSAHLHHKHSSHLTADMTAGGMGADPMKRPSTKHSTKSHMHGVSCTAGSKCCCVNQGQALLTQGKCASSKSMSRAQTRGAHIISEAKGEVRQQQRNSCGVIQFGQGHADALPVALQERHKSLHLQPPNIVTN